jgi:hypothetical protein
MLHAWRRCRRRPDDLDDKRLLQVLTELVCEQPDGQIARAADPQGTRMPDRLKPTEFNL